MERFKKVKKSIAPHLYDLDEAKSYVALQLFDVGSENTDKPYNINVLLVGDPSTGKTELLKYVGEFPDAEYVDCTHIRKRELIEKAKESRILCLDNFEELHDFTKKSLKNIMTHQLIAGEEKGKTNVSILAAMNPKFVSFDDFSPKVDQVHINESLRASFDAIVPIEATSSSFVEFAKFKLKERKPPLTKEEIQKLREEAKDLNPTLTKEAKKLLSDYFVALSKQARPTGEILPSAEDLLYKKFTYGIYDQLEKLCKARAKIEGKEEVEYDHAMDIITLQLGYGIKRAIIDHEFIAPDYLTKFNRFLKDFQSLYIRRKKWAEKREEEFQGLKVEDILSADFWSKESWWLSKTISDEEKKFLLESAIKLGYISVKDDLLKPTKRLVKTKEVAFKIDEKLIKFLLEIYSSV